MVSSTESGPSLAEVFAVGRARVREVLSRMAHNRIVNLYAQPEALFATPSIELANDVLEARRLNELAVALRLIDTLTPGRVARLVDVSLLNQFHMTIRKDK